MKLGPPFRYLATYVLLLAMLVIMLLLVPMEERELRPRFGAEYEDYCARVQIS